MKNDSILDIRFSSLPRGEAPSDFTKVKQCLTEVKSRHKSATKIKNEKYKCPVDVIVWS